MENGIFNRLHFKYTGTIKEKEKEISMKKSLKLLLLPVVLFSLTACGNGENSNEVTTAEATDKLVVYSPNSEGIINAVVPLFEETYGIDVELIQAGTGELMKRLSSETNDPYCDVMFGGSQINYVVNKDLFQDYTSAGDAELPEAYQNTLGYATSYVLDGRCLIVNKDLIGTTTVESYADLLKPELKGKISYGDPANSSSAFSQLANMLLAMGGYESDAAWAYVGNLLEQIDCVLSPSSSGIYKGVADGEMTVGVSYEDPCAKLVQNGANVNLVYPSEGTVFSPSSMAIVKESKNQINAQTFIDFVISKKVQDIFGSTLTNRPVRADAATGDYMTPIADIVTIQEDSEYVFSHKTEIVERFQELYISLQ